MELKIDKSNWKKVKLIDVVTKKEDNDRKNAQNRFERFLAVKHFDAETLHVKRWGEKSREFIPPTFYKIFRKGQILFPTRNPHLRRTVLAPFDGICGEKTLTLEVNENIAHSDFIPFLFNSENFVAHTTSSIIGSTNPHVRWRDVANYEFLLPPKAQQGRLAKLLWAGDEMMEKNVLLIKECEKNSIIFLNKSFKHGAFLNQKSKKTKFGYIPENWNLQRLDKLGEFKNGVNKGKKDFGFGSSFINLMDLFGYKELRKKKFGLVNVSKKELEQFNIKKGDVLFIRSSVKPSGVGLTTLVQENLDETVFSGFIIRFRPFDNELNHLFKKYCFYEKRFRYSLLRKSTISANTNINQASLSSLMIPIPPEKEQIEFVRRMETFEKLEFEIDSKIELTKSLQKSLINQIF